MNCTRKTLNAIEKLKIALKEEFGDYSIVIRGGKNAQIELKDCGEMPKVYSVAKMTRQNWRNFFMHPSVKRGVCFDYSLSNFLLNDVRRVASKFGFDVEHVTENICVVK